MVDMKVDKKLEAADVKEAPEATRVCPECKTEGTSRFCGGCGAQVWRPAAGALDPDGWGPGSKFARTIKVPVVTDYDGQEIEAVINGTRYFGTMPLTYDEYMNVWNLLVQRKHGDMESRFGAPGAKKKVDFPTMRISGR